MKYTIIKFFTLILFVWPAILFAQTDRHVIYINANQDIDFTVQVGARMYTKGETTPVADPPIKVGRPGDPYKGWRIESGEPATRYIINYKPLTGFHIQSESYTSKYDIPAGFDYFTYTTNIQLYPTKIRVWTMFEDASFKENKKAPFTITGPATYTGEAGGVSDAWEKTNIPWGTYTLTWGNVEGYQNPKPETFRILAAPEHDPPVPDGKLKSGIVYRIVATGEHTSFTTYYKVGSNIPPPPPPKTYCDGIVSLNTSKLKTGGIHVGSNASRATFSIEGAGIALNGEGNIWAKEEDVPLGTYTIRWGEVAGCVTPPPETRALTSGNIITFLGNYVPLGSKQPTAPPPPPARSPVSAPSQTQSPRDETPSVLQKPELTPPSVSAPQPATQTQKPSSLLKKAQNSISSFFSKIFSIFKRRPSSLIVPLPAGSELQGFWKIDKVYTVDEKGKEKEVTRSPGETERYTEFKGEKICLEGTLDSESVPTLCSTYTSFTVSGNNISISQQDDVTISGTWRIRKDKLELNLVIPTGSTTKKLKVVLKKFNPPVSTKSAPKAVLPELSPKLVPSQPLRPPVK